MSINRVPSVPFAQIANAALRDKRLSFKARGVLAMVLSNVGEWNATTDWIEQQSEKDGRHAVKEALRELSDLGYRVVSKRKIDGGRIVTVTDWFHEPQEIRRTENPPAGEYDGQRTVPSIEDYSLEHHHQNTTKTPVRLAPDVSASVSTLLAKPAQTPIQKPVGDDPAFTAFWSVYPRKTAKGHARRAWVKATRTTDPREIIAGAVRYRDDPNRTDSYTAHPATWLNGERWTDDPLPGRESRGDRKLSEAEAMIRRAAQRDHGIGEIES